MTTRFTNSKCDRCGKATKAMQNGEHDLYVLPREWGAPLADQGSFCEPCIERYTQAEWLVWFWEKRPGHRPGCLWATVLPTGHPNYWHCTCGYQQWVDEHE